MFRLIRLAFYALSVFAIVTANDEQQEAMRQGAEAFGAALVTACTREDGPCSAAAAAGRAQVAEWWGSVRDDVAAQDPDVRVHSERAHREAMHQPSKTPPFGIR